MLFPIYSFISWIYVYNVFKVGQSFKVKIYENNFLFGTELTLVSSLSVILLIGSFYCIIKQVIIKENYLLNVFLLLLIILLLFFNLWTLL